MKAIMFVLLFSLVSIGVSAGAVLTLAPSEAVLLPDDGSGGVRVAMRFDLSRVPWGADQQIIVANVDWPVASLSQDAPMTFTVKPITEAWNSVAAQSGASMVQSASEPSDTWVLDGLAYERLGGFLRFRVPDLVGGWLNDPTTNHGVLITFEEGAPVTLGSQLASAKLVVHYVIVPVEQQ